MISAKRKEFVPSVSKILFFLIFAFSEERTKQFDRAISPEIVPLSIHHYIVYHGNKEKKILHNLCECLRLLLSGERIEAYVPLVYTTFYLCDTYVYLILDFMICIMIYINVLKYYFNLCLFSCIKSNTK